VTEEDGPAAVPARIGDPVVAVGRADALVRTVLAGLLKRKRSVAAALMYLLALGRDVRANCRDLSQKAGLEPGDGTFHRLLGRYRWSWEQGRELLPRLAQEAPGAGPDADDGIGPGLAVDETTDLKRGTATACVSPQHSRRDRENGKLRDLGVLRAGDRSRAVPGLVRPVGEGRAAASFTHESERPGSVSAGNTARATLAAVHGDGVRALQHVLYRAAKADPKRRFHSLRDKVYREDVLWRAWIAVRRNNGAPGIDKTTLAEVGEYGVSRLLGELAVELRAGTWRPLPARKALIPKPGSTERRPLAIAAVRDRIVQAAVKIVLEPGHRARPSRPGHRR
jgi:RNA-directed DNA polymerase